jgi:hypothetical protein
VAKVRVTRRKFLDDRQGKTFVDVVNGANRPFDVVLKFFNDADRQRRMEESELHHDRPPLAGVVRELESLPAVDEFLGHAQTRSNVRFRQAIGVLVRLIMEGRGWQKTGRQGSLGVRAARADNSPAHNTGGLAFWFLRAERYERTEGMPFHSVRERCQIYGSGPKRQSSSGQRIRKTQQKSRKRARG